LPNSGGYLGVPRGALIPISYSVRWQPHMAREVQDDLADGNAFNTSAFAEITSHTQTQKPARETPVRTGVEFVFRLALSHLTQPFGNAFAFRLQRETRGSC
jgi:hypothetical protein